MRGELELGPMVSFGFASGHVLERKKERDAYTGGSAWSSNTTTQVRERDGVLSGFP